MENQKGIKGDIYIVLNEQNQVEANWDGIHSVGEGTAMLFSALTILWQNSEWASIDGFAQHVEKIKITTTEIYMAMMEGFLRKEPQDEVVGKITNWLIQSLESK